MNRTDYNITATVRDENGKIISRENGVKVTRIKLETVNIRPEDLEHHLTSEYRDLQALMPTHQITIDASVYNTIGDGWMSMAEYRGPEKQFIKFT